MNRSEIVIFILAGGFGTRLKSVVSNIPKPMAPILNKPFLDYQISHLRSYFPKSPIYLLTHYLSCVIENYFQDWSNVFVIKEQKPLGTGGSIKNALKLLKFNHQSNTLILNGDTYVDFDFNSIHKVNHKLTLVASYQQDCSRYGSLKITNNRVTKFIEKQADIKNAYINAGIYYFKDLSFFSKIQDDVFALEQQFKIYLKNNMITALIHRGVFIDIGIPEDYERMIQYISSK